MMKKEEKKIAYDEIDTAELLESLQCTSCRETFADGAFEAVNVGSFAQAQLIRVVGLNLGEFLDEGGVVSGKSSQLGKRSNGFVVFILFD